MKKEEHIAIIRKILKKHFNSKLESAELPPFGHSGFIGYVYKIKTKIKNKPTELIAKLTPFKKEKLISKEPYNERIEGSSRTSNFMPSYNLIRKSKIPTFKLYATGKIQNFIYQIISMLKGESVRPFTAYNKNARMNELHKIAGGIFGRLHKITRDYDGWIEQKNQNKTPWALDFIKTTNMFYRKCLKLNSPYMKGNKGKIKEKIDALSQVLLEPKQFVFSDTDGFEGMAFYNGLSWKFSGLIDLEDYKYTDQRMVLVGYEMSLIFEGRKVPKSFWDEYKKHKKVPTDYKKVRDLYKLYYLLSWFPMVYDKNWRGRPQDRMKTIRKFEIAFSEII